MATEEKTYTLDQIEEDSGYSRRTISYYVSEGLLPRVGQRGPRTRYSQHFLDRLLFLKKLKELQDKGRFPPLSLEQIKERVFRDLPPEVIARVASGKEPLTVAVVGAGAIVELGDELGRKLGDEVTPSRGESSRDVSMDIRAMDFELRTTRLDEPLMDAARSMLVNESPLTALLIQLRREMSEEEEGESSEEPGEWTTVEVTKNLLLTVRSKRRPTLKLVDRISKLLRKVVKGSGDKP